MSDLERGPKIGRIAVRQLTLLLHNKYVPAVILVTLLPLLFIRRVRPWQSVMFPWYTRPQLAGTLEVVIAIGVAAGLLLWASEGPHRRRYHWSLPIGRELHDSLRIVAGAVWLLVGIALLAVLGTLLEPAVLRDQWLMHAPVFYLSLFLVPLLTYLLASIYSQLTEHPLIWVLLTVLFAIMTQTELVEKKAPDLYDVSTAIFSSDRSLSLGAALVGGEAASPWHNGTDVWRVYAATAAQTAAQIKTAGQVEDERRMRALMLPAGYRARPAGEWLKALGLWYALALCGLALAVSRRPNV